MAVRASTDVSPAARDGGRHASRRLMAGLAATVALSALLLGVGLAIPDLRKVLDRAADIDPGWLALGAGLEVASCVGYALAFQGVFSRIPRLFAALVAWSESAFGAVVPVGGAGGIAAGAWLLHRRGLPARRIAERSAVLFLLTSLVNVVVLLLAGAGLAIGLLSGPHDALRTLGPALLAAGALAFFLGLGVRAARRRDAAPEGRVALALHAIGEAVRRTALVARRPGWRVGVGAPAYLLCDIAVLWVALHALGYDAPVGVLLVAYLLGYLVNAAPVPGGVGVLDGGLAGALVAYGAPAQTAAAGVLIYHGLALWIPTLGGTAAFAVAHRWTRQQDEPEAPAPVEAESAAPTGRFRREDRPCEGRAHAHAGSSAAATRRE